MTDEELKREFLSIKIMICFALFMGLVFSNRAHGATICNDRTCFESGAAGWQETQPAAPRYGKHRFRGVGLSGIRGDLAAKVQSIQAACPGTHVISALRHTYVAGTRRISLHASGRAVDVRGPYGCIYGELRGWAGGYSTDAARMRHIHISIGGREDGLRFRHGRHRRR